MEPIETTVHCFPASIALNLPPSPVPENSRLKCETRVDLGQVGMNKADEVAQSSHLALGLITRVEEEQNGIHKQYIVLCLSKSPFRRSTLPFKE